MGSCPNCRQAVAVPAGKDLEARALLGLGGGAALVVGLVVGSAAGFSSGVVAFVVCAVFVGLIALAA